MSSFRRRSLRIRGMAAQLSMDAKQDIGGSQQRQISHHGTESVVQDAENVDPSNTNHQRSPKAKKAKKGPTQLPKVYEKRLWQKGHQFVAGVDEAGRGPLAGPVVAVACIVTQDVDIPAIADSKTITEQVRESIYEDLVSHPGVTYAIGIQEAQEIDKINILQATYRAMEAAVAGLPESSEPTAVLIDGNRTPPNINAAHVETIIKGDGKVFSIAAASIIAKVTRDRMMYEADNRWPEYGFAQHKGYGTKAHMAAVRKFGPCPIHRLTFRPLPEIVAGQVNGAGKPGPVDVQEHKGDQAACEHT